MKTLTVDLGDRSYPIHIGPGLLSSLKDVLEPLKIQGKVGLISSRPIHDLYGQSVEQTLADLGCNVTTALVPDGEAAKDLATVSRLYDTFLKAGLDRASTLVSLGGGVVCDMTGFVAATLFRGVNFVQIPTTLLAMVDASIGGKTGVNHPMGKNLIGAIYQPQAVFIDPQLARTLPRRELTSAYAEILKAGAIADKDFFQHLAAHTQAILDLSDMTLLEDAIARACRIKAQVVAEDERESNRRRILNFGHTLGHALEAALGYGAIRHGEAVAIGMVGAGYLSTIHTGFTQSDLAALTAPLAHLDLPKLPALDADTVLSFLWHDKKVRRGALHFVLLESLGKAVISSDVTEDDLRATLSKLQGQFG